VLAVKRLGTQKIPDVDAPDLVKKPGGFMWCWNMHTYKTLPFFWVNVGKYSSTMERLG
jgi:hypothetical protein